ncbi:DNA primase [Psychromarinibacter halotolerans]|uniref:DNA primase n=1 Tax=Psychromarinibacter halotolerans TaxID=1775175 RepID=A0ABV7GU41_9RHOB|nr:DNA primase [Psychromarinibacter halotolerans]MDF0598674.1 DNA primase [Psychromarinibacter halotolerans]
MSLPPGFLDELRTRTSLSQVVGRKVMWDPRKSNQGKGDMWAPCPFHQEKSASFHVDDRKGFYYCFGCHAKGDAVTFVRETENVGFMEAVEILAREVGMQMPARDPQAQQKADRRTQLAEVMEQAVQHFRLQLNTSAAAEARDYLAGRGLSPEAQARWNIGFAPPGWQGLWDHLRGKDVPEDLILSAGLAKPSNRDGGRPYDTFRNRIMFPIRDARGRAIAFGGRAMDPTDNAKYLNSPETELFDKGRSLYNHGPAREAAGKGAPLLVAEGYMDVIALSEAGFGATVAPLGTAITEDQLQLLWRISPEPVIALDGDTAGLRAAMRLIDMVLPQLEAGKSLRFAIMPAGKDPDDVIRDDGAGAIQKIVDAAQPLVNLLWQRETEGKVFDSPERKAALDKSLRESIRKIPDPSLRKHYGDEINRLRWELFRGKRGADRPANDRNAPRRGFGEGGQRGFGRGFGRDFTPGATPGLRASVLVAQGTAVEDQVREAVIFAVLLTHPHLLPDIAGELEGLHPANPDHARLQMALLRHADADPSELRALVAQETGPDTLEKLFSQSHIAVIPAVRHPHDSETALLCLAEEFAKLEARRGAEREISEAMQDIDRLADEGLTWRLSQAALVKQRAETGSQEDTTEYDTAPTGAKMSRDERSAFDALIAKIEFKKPGRKST